MTAKRADIAEMPYWPLYLSREQAASYVGVSPGLFEIEVKAGLWPTAERRGLNGGRLTWYRPALDRAADARNGGGDDGSAAFKTWRSGFAQGREDRPKAPRGR
jgi:hypothetical protein